MSWLKFLNFSVFCAALSPLTMPVMISRRRGLELAAIDGAGGAVDRDEVAFLEGLAGDGDGLACRSRSRQRAAPQTQTLPIWRATSAACEETPPLAVRMPSAAIMPRRSSGEVSLRTRRTFSPLLRRRSGAVGVEVDLAGSGAGTGGKAGGDGLGLLHVGEVEDRGEELVELIGGVAQDGGFPVDELLLHHVHGELERGGGGALAVAGLEHEQLAFLDGELDVLHVLEVLLEGRADLHQLRVGLRHRVLELADTARACARRRRRLRPGR